MGGGVITGKIINWFVIYLSNHRQRVILCGHASKWLPLNSGVPHGSILGPLMVLIHIGDIARVLEHSKICLFADVAEMYIKVHDADDCLKFTLLGVTLWIM